MFCRRCGKKLNEGEQVCSNCGEKVDLSGGNATNYEQKLETISNNSSVETVYDSNIAQEQSFSDEIQIQSSQPVIDQPNIINQGMESLAPQSGNQPQVENTVQQPTPFVEQSVVDNGDSVKQENITLSLDNVNAVNGQSIVNQQGYTNESVPGSIEQSLGVQQQPLQATQSMPNQIPGTSEQSNQGVADNEKPKNNKMILFVVLALVVIAVVVGLVLIIINNNNRKTTETNTPDDVLSNLNRVVIDEYTITVPENLQYNVNGSILEVMDNERSMSATIMFGDDVIDFYRLNPDKLEEIIDDKFSVTCEYSTESYDGREFLNYRFSYEDYDVNYFVTDLNDNQVMFGLIYEGVNYSPTFSYSYISSIIDGIEKNGNASRLISDVEELQLGENIYLENLKK